MQEQRFDAIARSLGSATSRRHLLKVLFGGAVGGLGVALGRTPVLAEQHDGGDDDNDESPGNPHAACNHYCKQYKHEQKRQCKAICRACAGGASHMCGLVCGCPTPANATATCNGGVCGATCQPGFHTCGGACVSNGSVANCGTSCTACPTPPNGTATCNGTSCGVTCNAGFTLCNGACVNAQADNNNCGGCGAVCPTGKTCSGGSCVCNAGTTPCGLGCCGECGTCFNGSVTCPPASGSGCICVAVPDGTTCSGGSCVAGRCVAP